MGQATSTYPVHDDAATMDLVHNIAAIDFGTTFCSLAFKVGGNSIESLKINDTFDRVPNAILIKKDQHGGLNVADIGFVAQKKYKNIPPAKYNDYLYFECFKMQLRDEEKLSRDMMISAFAGSNYYIIEVIALILQHLRTRFEKYLTWSPHQIRDGLTLRKLKATDFYWVLTVPAIWKDRGKQMMREAAYRGGLLCDVPPIERLTAPPTRLSEPNIPYAAKEKLVLALEPECAALYCQQLTSDMMATYCDRSSTINSKRYMVLDIGGGTVDIAIHDLVADKTINSVLPPTGNDWGGMKVNNEFSVLLQKMTGDKEFRNFYTTQNKEALHKAIIANLVFQDFELPKKQFGESSLEEIDDDAVFIRVDPRLVKFYGQKLEESSNKYGVEFDDDTISIAFSKMKELFQPAINGIVSCMMSAMQRSPVAIDTIFLVGGFGGCPYVYTKVKETLGRRNISVVVPTDHKVAVAQGAVIFRQKMSIFNSRVSDAYYGVEITDTYDDTKHPAARRVYNNTDKCYEVKNYFSSFVCKGQSVNNGEKFEKTLYPSISTQTSITLAIYRTTKDGVMFTKDLRGNPIPGIEELGELNLPAPISGLSILQRKVKLELILGGTELQVKAVYGPTGVEVNATLDFLKRKKEKKKGITQVVNTPAKAFSDSTCPALVDEEKTVVAGDEKIPVASDKKLVNDDNIATIDFGTTFCSLAFKVKKSTIESLMINDTFDRVPNTILIKKDQHGGLNVADIGFVAQKKYKNIPPAKYNDYLYFECFKMQLRDEEKLSRDMMISAFAGSNYYIIEVIALILQHLRTRFEKYLTWSPHEIRDGSTSRKLKATDFYWVLTVPAIWKDRGKQMMREAAYRAGLLCDVPPIEKFTIPPTRLSEPSIPSAAEKKLMLALEPECAALYCQQLTSDMMATYCDRSATVSSKRYMVLDIGGGTVDIAIHDSVADKTINSVLPPTGNDWGGMKVNNEFSVLLQKITGDKEFRNFYTTQNKEALHKAIIANLVFQDFELPKKQFGESSLEEIDDDAVFIRVDPRLVKFYGQQFEESSNKYGVEFDDDTISIAFSKMKELFQPAINGIVSCMMSAMQRSPVAIDTIFLVGGFGGCPYVYTKVKETLGRRNISVVVPTYHKVAVAQGAVIFRQQQGSLIFKEKEVITQVHTPAGIFSDSTCPALVDEEKIVVAGDKKTVVTGDNKIVDDHGNIAAIDFGTMFCSLAYKIKESNIENLKIDGLFVRVLNAILIKKNQNGDLSMIKIGLEAQNKYNYIPPARYDDYLYFDFFKMQLRDEEKLSRDMMISAFDGSNYYIIEVIALMLQHLRMRFEKHLSISPHQKRDGSTLRKLKATDFYWVLTVPAIWKDRGKQMMREAAYRAGLLCDVPPIEKFTIPPTRLSEPNIPYAAKEKLVLALELECAALYCQQMTNDMMAAYCDRYTADTSKQYMVLDIGGGTIDIAIHNLVADNTIDSVLPPTGNDWGGMKVNNEFSVLLQKITGDKEFRNFYTTGNKEALHKAIITKLVFQDFEQPKKQFGECSLEEIDDDAVFIRVDPRLVKFYGQQFEESSNKYGVEFDDDTISIAFSKMKELFQPAIDGIVSCMMSAIEKSPVAIDTIYLVGGFGGCPYVYTKVKETLGRRNISVVVPTDHKVAVAQGAVIFRQQQGSLIFKEKVITQQQQLLEEATKLDDERKKSDRLTRELDEEKGRLGGVLRKLDGVRKELDEERKKSNGLTRELGGVRKELDEERKKSDGLTRELDGVKKELDEERKKLGGITRELGEARKELDEERRELGGVKKVLDEERRELGEVRKELDEERRRLGGELEVARQTNDNFTKIIESHQEEAPWKVGRHEIDITSQELGRGAWATVNVAYFRGTPVAAKCLHDVIISDYNKSIFIREMNLAAKLRHPNLTLFVGATLVNNPIFLSELMPTSLRKELERSRLTQPQIIKISSDVCCGLSYLHLFQPSPIVHRDVSNANVLLEPSGGAGEWKAKVSDYGSANLIHNISPNSVMPGCMSYAAPEARFPDDHSPAMDVYSFGVLLMEMILHTPPSPTVAGRESQSKTIEWESMKLLVQPCLMNDRHKRPLIGHVLKELRKQ